MPKQYNINWRKVDKQKVSRTVGQFNAKITRTLKKMPELADYLPNKITTQEIKEKIKTRQDFNREINSLNRFLKKGAETPILSKSGIKTTKWEKTEIGYRVRTINARRKIERERAQPSTEKGTMGTIEANALKPKQYDIDKIKSEDWESYVESVEKQSMSTYQLEKIERYKQNYIEAIKRNLLSELDIDDPEYIETQRVVMELLEYVENISPEFIYYSYYDDPVLQINFTSDPLPVRMIAESALEGWKNAIKGVYAH